MLLVLVTQAFLAYSWKFPPAVTRVEDTRVYRYTYVTDRGEESAPSPESVLLTLDQNDTASVTIPSPTVAAPYGPLAYWRLYRSSTTDTGNAPYQFVAEIPINTLTYTDSKLQEELGEILPSSNWTEPRSDLFALTGLHNGILAGLADEGKILCFSEGFTPYAWPRDYEIVLEYPGVGLGVFGQTLVVLTEGRPSYVSGADPATMSEQKMESPQACAAKRTIVSTEGGVIYASPDGICIAGPQGVELVTQGAYSRDDWQALGLTTAFAEYSEGVYYIVTEN